MIGRAKCNLVVTVVAAATVVAGMNGMAHRAAAEDNLEVNDRAAGAETLDERQREIVKTVTDRIVREIEALKEKYPQLERFGLAPEFSRSAGEFRYHYQLEEVQSSDGKPQAKALKDGCGIYFRLATAGAPLAKWSTYYRWQSIGGARAGISHNLSITTWRPKEARNDSPLRKEIYRVVRKELEGSFEQLAAEYLVEKHGVALDEESLLAEAEKPASPVAKQSLTSLSFRELTPKQLARIRRGFRGKKLSVDLAIPVARIIERQDTEHLLELYQDLVRVAIDAERTGRDAFSRTPFFGQSWASSARQVRQYVASKIGQSGQPRFLPVAQLLLSEEPQTATRLGILQYLNVLNDDRANALLVASLHNDHRSVQAKAAEIAGEKRLESAVDGLQDLTASYSPRVREQARDAIEQFGVKPRAETKRALPQSARRISKTLWKAGLTDADVMRCCAPRMHGTSRQFKMTEVSADAVRRGADKWVETTGWREPGPLLLAAAVKLGEEATALTLYETLCDRFETDDAVLDAGVRTLAWHRFLDGLERFQRKQDAEALPLLSAVVKLRGFAGPHTLLASYVKQSEALIPDIRGRLNARAEAVPDPSERERYIRYWIVRIPEINGIQPGQPGTPSIWMEQCKWSDIPKGPFASNKLREVGLAALPYLIDEIDDPTPTRTVGYSRDFHPTRYLVTVGEAAQWIFTAICRDNDLEPPTTLTERRRLAKADMTERKTELRAWLKEACRQ